ncbi:MAG: hypothetical protein AAGA77_06030 [Bacteroidota bacterium]
MDRIGIIDLGSNTFHILIVDIDKNGVFDTIHKERSFVGLAEEGLQKISEKAIIKGVQTLTHFKSLLESFHVSKFKITGTAALRSAENKDIFIATVREQIGLDIEVIQGDREAELIFKGVSMLHPMTGNHLIMDIGGGSVEFILVENGLNSWSKSSNIGVGVLHSAFHNSEPISKKEIDNIVGFIHDELMDLRSNADNVEIDSLIGASGSFEVVESMNGNPIYSNKISTVSLENYHQVSSRIINASFEERNRMEGLPSSRVKLIVVAMILIDVVIEMIQPKELRISPYALKEGLLSELYT